MKYAGLFYNFGTRPSRARVWHNCALRHHPARVQSRRDMSAAKRRILVTSALPYANGSLHLGHMVEYVQTDIWVRFQKLRGHDCLYVCAADSHGTPIMLRARSEGIEPEALIARYEAEQVRDFADFRVVFDNYHTTHSAENRELVELIYGRLQAQGHIATRTIRQAYDEQEKIFLPDRYVRGECPVCGTPDQHGDSCENCSATYAPLDIYSCGPNQCCLYVRRTSQMVHRPPLHMARLCCRTQGPGTHRHTAREAKLHGSSVDKTIESRSEEAL